MATREEIADILAGFALFGDLQTPQLLGVAGTFEEVCFPQGERILRQGLTGDRVLRDPRGQRGRHDRRHAARDAPPGRLLRRGLDPARRAADRRRRRVTPVELPRDRRAPRSSRSSSTTRGSCTGCSRRRPAGCATRTAGGAEAWRDRVRRSPLPARRVPGHRHRQRARAGSRSRTGLRHYGIEHAVLSADPAPGGMFRSWPFFQRLLSWTKPYAPEARTAREYQRYDWNSLLAFEPELRSMQTEFMDGSSYFPSRPEMQASLEAFAERAAIAVRYGCTLADHGQGGRPGRHDVRARDHGRRVPHAGCSCSRSASPSRGARRRPGSSTRATTRTRATRRGTRASGSSSSASRTRASSSRRASRQWASAITVCSPSPAKTSVEKRVAGRASGRATSSRSRTTPSASGVKILDASIDRDRPRGRRPAGRHQAHRQRRGAERRGRRGHRRDRLHVPAPGPAGARRHDVRPGQAAGRDAALGERRRCPGSTSRGRSARRRPGCASTASRQLGRGPRAPLQRPDPRPPHRGDALRHGRPTGRSSRRTTSCRSCSREATRAPELWHQKAYLARVISLARRRDPRRGDPAARARARRDDRGRHRDDRRGRRHGRRSTRSSTSAATGASPSTRCPAHPLLDFETRGPRGGARRPRSSALLHGVAADGGARTPAAVGGLTSARLGRIRLSVYYVAVYRLTTFE